MDSLFHSFLSEAGLNVRSGVRMLRPAADQVISQTGDASIQRGSFVTTPLRLTEDASECVQGVVPGSVMTVIHSVWYLFLPLGMVFVFCLLCIVLLWRAWRQQRRLEQFRKDFTYSMIHDIEVTFADEF